MLRKFLVFFFNRYPITHFFGFALLLTTFVDMGHGGLLIGVPSMLILYDLDFLVDVKMPRKKKEQQTMIKTPFKRLAQTPLLKRNV